MRFMVFVLKLGVLLTFVASGDMFSMSDIVGLMLWMMCSLRIQSTY
jgi:hypothetical protein